MWLKLYENLNIFGREMNELYKFEGVLKPTFIKRTVIIKVIHSQLRNLPFII